MHEFLYKIYKVIFLALVFLYINTIHQIVSYLLSTLILIFMFPFNFESITTKLIAFDKMIKIYSEGAKDEWLEYIYKFRNNSSNEILDWCPKFVTTFIALNFRDDCDSFAYLSYLAHNKKPKMYAVIPYNPKNLHMTRIIAVFNGKIYSAGQVHNLTIKEYINWKYTFVDCLVTRYF